MVATSGEPAVLRPQNRHHNQRAKTAAIVDAFSQGSLLEIGGLPSDLPGTVSEGMAFFAPLRLGEK
jgi:hypothetical protein